MSGHATPLGAQIAAQIAKTGPMRIDAYWNRCLFDRSHGYYNSAEPFGEQGDFTTAPEISQMFGELLGAWVAATWEGLGRPSPFILCEIGPGRGTLMADMIRTLRRAAPQCLGAARIRLVEVSERLAALQAVKLEPFDLPIKRVRRFAEVEAMPLILVANELFDAIAIRQFVHDDGAWSERCVGLNEDGGLTFGRIPIGEAERQVLAAFPSPKEPGEAILELSPERDALAAEIGAALGTQSGAGLFVDYGHARSGFGDTLQALSKHRPVSCLDRPGEADITSHVDFSRLGALFARSRLAVSPVVEQGAFLLSLGLAERAGQLGTAKSEAVQADLIQAVQRLAGTCEGQMGRLFKVLCASSRPLALPPFGLQPAD